MTAPPTPSDNLPLLVEQLASPRTWALAWNALNASGQDALKATLDGINHPNWRVRRWCVAFLDHHADTSCLPALEKALADPSTHVRRNAIHAIGCQGCKAEPLPIDVVGLLLKHAVGDSSVRVRRAATHLLGQQRDDARIRPVLTLLAKATDAGIASNATWALNQITMRR